MEMQHGKVVSILAGKGVWYDSFEKCGFDEVCDVEDIKPIIMKQIQNSVKDIQDIRKGTDSYTMVPKFVSFLSNKAFKNKLSSSFRREMILFSMLTDSIYKGVYEDSQHGLYEGVFDSVLNESPLSPNGKRVFMKKSIRDYYKKELDRQHLKLYIQAPKYGMDTVFCFKDCWFTKQELINLHTELLIPCMFIDLVCYYSGMKRDKIDIHSNDKIAVDFRRFVNILADEVEWNLKIHYANPKLLAIGEIEC